MKFFKTTYFKNIYNQAFLVGIAQLIPVLFSPLITRIYDENAVAELTGLMSLTSILLVFSTLKLENVIVLEKENNKAKDAVVLTVLLAIGYTALISIGLFVFKEKIQAIFKIDNVLYIVPFYVLSFSMLTILNHWFVRQKKFKHKAYSKLIETSTYVALSVVLFYVLGENNFGLALGKVLGVFVAFCVLVNYLKIRIKLPEFSKLKHVLIEYKVFPLYNTPSNFVNVIGLQLIIIFIGIYFTKEQLGYFGLANMIVLLPVSFISQSMGSIFFQKVSELINQNKYIEVQKTFYQTLLLLLLIAIPGFLVLYFGGSYLFTFFYGTQWALSGIIASQLAIVFLFQTVSSPLGMLLIAVDKVKTNAYWQYGRVLFMLPLLFVLAHYYSVDFLTFIQVYCFAEAIVFLVYLIIIVQHVRQLTKRI